MKGAPQSEQSFPVERKYTRCTTALPEGTITVLPKLESSGMMEWMGESIQCQHENRLQAYFLTRASV